MPGTLTEKHTGNELLKRYLATHKVKIAKSVDELYLHSVTDDNGEEIDGLLRLLQEWRSDEELQGVNNKLNSVPPKKVFKGRANFNIGGRRRAMNYDFSDFIEVSGEE